MTDQRQFYRASSFNHIELIHHDRTHKGQLENISLNGALIRLEGPPGLRPADACLLRVRTGGEPGATDSLQIGCEVVHAGAELVGIRFVGNDEETIVRLPPLMKLIQRAEDLLDEDLRRIRAHLETYRSTR